MILIIFLNINSLYMYSPHIYSLGEQRWNWSNCIKLVSVSGAHDMIAQLIIESKWGSASDLGFESHSDQIFEPTSKMPSVLNTA